MARPVGKFQRQAERLLAQLKYLGANKRNSELAHDLEVSETQVKKYLRYLRSVGSIQVRIHKTSVKGSIKTVRIIEVK